MGFTSNKFVFSFLFVFHTVNGLIFDHPNSLVIFSLVFIPFLVLSWYWYQKRNFHVTDEEIEAQLAIYEEWRNHK